MALLLRKDLWTGGGGNNLMLAFQEAQKLAPHTPSYSKQASQGNRLREEELLMLEALTQSLVAFVRGRQVAEAAKLNCCKQEETISALAVEKFFFSLEFFLTTPPPPNLLHCTTVPRQPYGRSSPKNPLILAA